VNGRWRNTIPADANFEALLPLREDLALVLRAAAYQGVSEGVCNHFNVAVHGWDDWFLLNPFGLHWSEVQAPDIVMCNAAGEQLAGRHPDELVIAEGGAATTACSRRQFEDLQDAQRGQIKQALLR